MNFSQFGLGFLKVVTMIVVEELGRRGIQPEVSGARQSSADGFVRDAPKQQNHSPEPRLSKEINHLTFVLLARRLASRASAASR